MPDNMPMASVRIGFGDVGHYDRKRSRSIWQVSGEVHFAGKAFIGHGSKISVRGKLFLGEDFNITAESTIICAHEISFGKNCLLSWDILVMDTDEHPICDKWGDRINADAPIVIGNHVWVGCKCTILKKTQLPDNTIIAAGSLLRSAFVAENQIIGGNPVKVLKSEVNWRMK